MQNRRAEKNNAYLFIGALVRRAGIHDCVSKWWLITRRWDSLRHGGELRNKTGLVSLTSDLIECVSVGAAERRASINEWVQNIELSTRGSQEPRGKPSISLLRERPLRTLLKI